MIHTHTIVVRYPEGTWPAYSADTKINGGELVAVDFDGNRLQIAQELEEALDDLINRPFKAGTRKGDEQRDRARAALAKAQSLSRGEIEA